MAVRTNTANGGTTYIDMDIQVVSDDASQTTLRAVIYLTSRNVTDTTNNCSVTGQWSRSGVLGLGGVYNQVAVWSQDVSFAKTSAIQQVGWNLAWSSVDYWGTTLSGTAYAQIAAAVGPPSTPYGYSARNITTTSAYTTGVTVDSDGGGGFANLQVQWALPGGAGLQTRVMNAFTDGYMDGMSPGTFYDFRVAVSNPSYWSPWGGWVRFATAPAQTPAPTVSAITGTTATAAMVTSGTAIDQVVYRVYDSGGNRVIDYFSPVGQVPLSYALTGLTPGASYTIGVFQHTTAGYSPESPRTAFTMANVPAAPAASTVSAITQTTATVSWVAPANGGMAINRYAVQVATDAAFSNLIYAVWWTASPAALTGLPSGVGLFARILAENGVGQSAWSATTPFTTLAVIVNPTIGLMLNVAGTWKDSELWLNDRNTWKLCELWENVAGTWKRVN